MLSRKAVCDQCVFCLYRSQFPRTIQQRSRRTFAGWASSTGASGPVRRKGRIPLAKEKIYGELDSTLGEEFTKSSTEGAFEEERSKVESPGEKPSKRLPRRTFGAKKIVPNSTIAERNERLKATSQSSYHDLTLLQLPNLVASRFATLRKGMSSSRIVQSMGLKPAAFQQEWEKLEQQFALRLSDKTDRLSSELMTEIEAGGKLGIDMKIRHLFIEMFYKKELESSGSYLKSEKDLADYTHPEEAILGARRMTRHIHLHVGPTNSGKTYQALKRLEAAESGTYAGPLRLLAHEVYSRLNAKGIPCNLVTGEERRVHTIGEVSKTSSTVEMVSLNTQMEVAVIDEIQMIGDLNRGWAWTEAVLGVQAKEVHLCGEERVVPLIEELAASTGDTVTVHRYERLSPLRVMDTSIDGNISRLQKGDCMICFSRTQLHMLKHKIEQLSNKKCAIVYGGLPPESRAQQAKLFNDPENEYDFLVATDAIGMGLNLAIKRIVFYNVKRNNGIDVIPLKPTDVKQIAGRAGRYRTASQAIDVPTTPLTEGGPNAEQYQMASTESVGLVTVFEEEDLGFVQRSMQSEITPLKTAGLIPTNEMVTNFSARFPPEIPLSFILVRLQEIMRLPRNGRYHLCSLGSQVEIANSIQHIKGLSLADRLVFIAAPAQFRDDSSFEKMLVACAELVAGRRRGDLLEMAEFQLEILEEPLNPDGDLLTRLEQLHKGLVLYLWLSFRFTTYFTCRAVANHAKELVEKRIADLLELFSTSKVAPTRSSLRPSFRAPRIREGMSRSRDENGPRRTPKLLTRSDGSTMPRLRRVSVGVQTAEPSALRRQLQLLST